MRGDSPDPASLYENAMSRQWAQRAAAVEGLGYSHWTRLRETAELAERMGFTRVGVAYCPDMVREALQTALFLRDYGLGVQLPPEPLDCDPLGQAALLGERDTQLNVIAGMCVGHEAAFIRASPAPVTVLVARDERLRHNPAAALYTAEGYSHADLYDGTRLPDPLPHRGSDNRRILAAARKLLPEKHERRSRIHEAMEFARLLGIDHLGLSFCVGFRREARVLKRVLEAHGFHVSSVCCKVGALPKQELGIPERHKVRPNEPEMICNPVGQAELLNRAGVQLAFILGQCVGHDSATFQRLESPAVCLVAKDRVLAHNSVAALYALEE